MTIKAMALKRATSRYVPMGITRRAPGAHDLELDIAYCGASPGPAL